MFKLLRYNIRLGIFEERQKYISALMFSAFLCVCFYFDAIHLSVLLFNEVRSIRSLALSFGDFILLEQGSCILRDGLKNLSFPTIWLLYHIIPCYMVLHLAYNDLEGHGIQILIRSKSKIKWWYSKCLLCAVSVMIYYTLNLLIPLLFCKATGIRLSWIPNPQIISAYYQAMFFPELVTEGSMMVSMWLMPMLVTIAMSLLQLVLTLLYKPIIPFIVICSLYIGSVVCVTPAFLPNYAMPIRSEAIGIYNFDFYTCFLYSIVLIFISVILGRFKILKMDLLQRNML